MNTKNHKAKRGPKPYQPTLDDHKKVIELLEVGTPIGDLPKHLGISYSLLNKWFRPTIKSYKKTKKDPRHCDMCDLFRSGKTLQVIGDKYGITRERVRQILSGYGLSGADGGNHVVAMQNKLERNLERKQRFEKRCQKNYGIDYKTYKAIKKEIGSSRIRQYYQLANHVVSGIGYKANTKWEFNLKTYCQVWKDAGREVQEDGYYFSRIDTNGDFTPKNVRIITSAAFGHRVGKQWGWQSDYQKQLNNHIS